MIAIPSRPTSPKSRSRVRHHPVRRTDDPAEGQIEAIARSRLFGFEDEVAIRVTETDTGTRIDMRSRSRLGQIDRGANARRIEVVLADLQTRARN